MRRSRRPRRRVFTRGPVRTVLKGRNAQARFAFGCIQSWDNLEVHCADSRRPQETCVHAKAAIEIVYRNKEGLSFIDGVSAEFQSWVCASVARLCNQGSERGEEGGAIRAVRIGHVRSGGQNSGVSGSRPEGLDLA